MQTANETRIALVIRSKEIREDSSRALSNLGFTIDAYAREEEAIQAFPRNYPSLIIFEHSQENQAVAFIKDLRKDFLLSSLPIMLLIPDNTADKGGLISLGVDEYLQFADIAAELAPRVKLNLERLSRGQDINSLTRLPGQGSLYRELSSRIASKETFVVNFLDLFKFKAFNHRYGFSRGDEVMKFTSSTVTKILKGMGSPHDFLCHPQSDNFLFFTATDSQNIINPRIIEEFDKGIKAFYEEEDLQRGYIMIKNRMGQIQKIPFMTVHIGVVSNEFYQFFSPVQVMQIVTELKNFAQDKYPEKSMFVKERRKNYPFC